MVFNLGGSTHFLYSLLFGGGGMYQGPIKVHFPVSGSEHCVVLLGALRRRHGHLPGRHFSHVVCHSILQLTSSFPFLRVFFQPFTSSSL